jgi:hypothetical protein
MMEKADKKLAKFLNGLTEVEYRTLEFTLQLCSGFKDLIKDYNLSKERFCELFQVKEKDYDSYIKGGKQYDLHDIAKLKANSISLAMEKMAADSPIKFKDK